MFLGSTAHSNSIYCRFEEHRLYILPTQGLLVIFNNSSILHLIKCLITKKDNYASKPLLHTREGICCSPSLSHISASSEYKSASSSLYSSQYKNTSDGLE